MEWIYPILGKQKCLPFYLSGVGIAEPEYHVIREEGLVSHQLHYTQSGRGNLVVGGAILAVSQFTLYGDARGGRRPSFIAAARPEEANERYEQLVAAWRAQGIHVETGRFRADMQVSLVNDGPVTILMDSTKAF